MAYRREGRKKRSKFGRDSHPHVEYSVWSTARGDENGCGVEWLVSGGTHSDHLHMALLELALDAVEVGGVGVVALICLLDNIVVDLAFLDRARPILLRMVRHGEYVRVSLRTRAGGAMKRNDYRGEKARRRGRGVKPP